jgi:hypothetical protein
MSFTNNNSKWTNFSKMNCHVERTEVAIRAMFEDLIIAYVKLSFCYSEH